ncbi:MAG: hypothetical protein CMM52_07065 [Rhodospirillaceae bacterium]|nr:hypothetical protein [Rhodospirillaceae bacterium]|tara:strand:+ start:51728 stop:52009 length:282 start_codon:yes stop_codon:yes gene_type:complete
MEATVSPEDKHTLYSIADSRGSEEDLQSSKNTEEISAVDSENHSPSRLDGNFIPAALIKRLPAIYHASREGYFVFRNDEFNEIAQVTFPEFRS